MKISIGDIMLVDGRSFWNVSGYIIREVENNGIYPTNIFSPNHVGIVIKTADKIENVRVLSAYPGKPLIQPLSYWLKQKDTNIVIRNYRDFIPDYQKRKMESWMYKYFKDKIPYDTLSILGIYAKYLILKNINNKIIKTVIRYLWNDNVQNIGYLNCAELIYKSYKSIGLMPISFFPDYILPSHYYISKRWRTIFRHHNYEYPRI